MNRKTIIMLLKVQSVPRLLTRIVTVFDFANSDEFKHRAPVLVSGKVPRLLRTFSFMYTYLRIMNASYGKTDFFFHKKCHEVSTVGIYHDESKT